MKVKLKNFKVFEEIEKDLNGSSVYLLGDNNLGKSSFLQGIKIALGSKDIPSNLQDGATGIVEIDKDGKPYTFSFDKKKGKVELKVTLPDGVKESKKGIITGIVGPVDFNINEFIKQSESVSGRKKQVEDFKKLLPAEFVKEIDLMSKKVDNLYDERTELNRKIDTLKGFLNEDNIVGKDLKAQPVDVSALTLELEKANDHNKKIDEVISRKEQRESEIAKSKERKVQIEEQIAALMKEAEGLDKSIQENTEKNAQASDWLSKNEKVDTSAITAQINSANETNILAAKAAEHNKKLSQLKELQEQVENLTIMIDGSRQAIADAIRDMDSPVEGLSFNADSLIYNGIAVEDASLCTSEKIELGYKIANASNPNLGLLFLEQGESLGKERFNELIKFCKKNNIQLFLEQVVRGKDELEVQFIPELME